MNLRSYLGARKVTHHRVCRLNSLGRIIRFSRGELREKRTIVGDIIMPVRKLAAKSFIQMFEIQTTTKMFRNSRDDPFLEKSPSFTL